MQHIITLLFGLWLSQITVVLFVLFWTKGIERDFDRKVRKIQNGYESYFRRVCDNSDSDTSMDDSQR